MFIPKVSSTQNQTNFEKRPHYSRKFLTQFINSLKPYPGLAEEARQLVAQRYQMPRDEFCTQMGNLVLTASHAKKAKICQGGKRAAEFNNVDL